ncbi:MAG: DUF1559 domain-containing protein [Pirellulales bacterium]|nr:DUF1559 domain-containing protein [Pirellulales bacterium]
MRVSGQRKGGREINQLRRGFTLIELLVVISIVGLLMAMLFPALNVARESSRRTACSANLRQFGIGMATHAQCHQSFCSGAFDWRHDGCVTEIGWVADLVKQGTPVGKMLCPSNPCQISHAYNDLLNKAVSSFDDCVNWKGSPATTEPDGTVTRNPCRAIAELGLAPGSEERRAFVEKYIFLKHFNTNYTASWWLVRSGVKLDEDGNLVSDNTGCPASRLSRHATLGPLTRARADAAHCSSSFLPLLGCGAAAKPLTMPIGTNLLGVPTAHGMTAGPVTNPNMATPSFAAGTPREGASGWLAGWKTTLQDYRHFGPVHRGSCNLLFADGSVRFVTDTNGDGLLNNGFQPAAENGFSDDKIELSEDDVLSEWKLR